MSHHAEKPAVEQFSPMRIFAGHEVGQGTDAVFSVPAPGAVEVFFYRVIEGDIIGRKVACYIAVPYADTFFQGI